MNLSKPVWTIVSDSNKYRSFTIHDNSQYLHRLEILNRGQKLGNLWEPLYVELYHDEEGWEQNKPIGDFIQLFGPSINKKARNILEPLIGNTVEFLPLETSTGLFWALNVSWINCLDLPRSDVKYFSNGKVLSVERYSFFEERLKDIHMFHIIELRASGWFVSDEFRKAVEDNDFQGLLFYPVA
jgi:hypothetical protein